MKFLVWLLPIAVACSSGGDSDSKKRKKAGKAPMTGKAPPSTNSAPKSPTLDRNQMWKNDLRHLAETLPAKHTNAFFKLQKADFLRAVSALEGKISTLTDTGVVVEMSRIVAMIGEGHTALDMSAAPALPIRFFWFEEGLHVVGIAAEHDWAMGKQVHSIGGIEVETLLDKVAPYIARDNQPGLLLRAPGYLAMGEILHHLGAAGANRSARFSISDGKGGHRAIELGLPKGPVSWARPPWPTALRRKKLQLNYWNEYLAKHNAVYMKYNRCADMKSLPFAQFAPGMLAFIDQKKVERVIIDLRGNQGGNSMIFRPLLTGLQERKRLRGKIYAIIDRAVFSSALLNSIELKQMVGATLIGEATSGKPNHYGEVKTFKLPHSGLRVSYSTKFFRKLKGDPPTLEPDIAIPVRAANIMTGKDAALEAALSHR